MDGFAPEERPGRGVLELSVSSSHIPIDTKPMDTKQSRRIPRIQIQFRVLIIGRANAGKTTILQRVCDTTESPTIYRQNSGGREEVRHGSLSELPISSYTTQIKIEPSMLVSDERDYQMSPLNPKSAWRARHRPRTCVLQSYGLYFSRFARYRVWWYRGTGDIARIHSM